MESPLERLVELINELRISKVDVILPEETFEYHGIDSLDFYTLLIAIEDRWQINIPEEATRDIVLLTDLATLIEELS